LLQTELETEITSSSHLLSGQALSLICTSSWDVPVQTNTEKHKVVGRQFVQLNAKLISLAFFLVIDDLSERIAKAKLFLPRSFFNYTSSPQRIGAAVRHTSGM
jgi:hypothetical protein